MSKEKQQISASKIQLSSSSKTFYVICYVVVGLMALICLLPLLVIIGSSFTSENYIRFHGYTLIPREFNLDAYAAVLTQLVEEEKPDAVFIGGTQDGKDIAPVVAAK